MAIELYDRVRELCDDHGTTPEALARELGMSPSSIRKWNVTVPSVDKVKSVAEYFDVSIDYLIGSTDIPITADRLALDDDFIQIIREQVTSDSASVRSFPKFRLDALRVATRWQNLDDGGRKTALAVIGAEEDRLRSVEKENARKIIPLFGNSFAAGIGEPDFGNALEEYEVNADCDADFAVKVNGESMEPYLHDGQIALGKKGFPKIGDIVAIMVDGAFYVKQFVSDNYNNIYLLSLNRMYPDVPVMASSNSTIRCFGIIQTGRKIPLAN